MDNYEYDAVMSVAEAMAVVPTDPVVVSILAEYEDQTLGEILTTRAGRGKLREALQAIIAEPSSMPDTEDAIQLCLAAHQRKQQAYRRSLRRRAAKQAAQETIDNPAPAEQEPAEEEPMAEEEAPAQPPPAKRARVVPKVVQPTKTRPQVRKVASTKP